jgi:hypothetical protein
MTPPISEEMLHSQGIQYAISKGWNFRQTGDQIEIERCPLCQKDNYHFRMAWMGTHDGLYLCMKCGESGNLRALKEQLGDAVKGVESRSEWAGQNNKKIDPLPDVATCHAALLGDADAMDYLLNVRGFSPEIIEKYQLGLKDKVFFRKTGEVRALVIPYLVQGNIVFAKYRTLPPAEKDFISPSGWEVPLYNEEILREGLREIIFVEGEADCLSCLSNGITNVAGVPGANIKKASWIETLDRIAPERIYILYDSDKVGQKAAQEIASRIGIDKCRKLTLPYFSVPVGDGTTRPGKDINEWFRYGGGTLEQFEVIKGAAQLFDVTGVTSASDALTEIEEELAGKEDIAPSRVSPWPELNRLVGFEEGDVIDIVAPEKIGKTTFGLNLVDHMVKTYKEPGLILCLEMTQKRLAKKWVSLVTGYEDTITEPGSEESRKKLEELKLKVKEAREVQQGREADLYFAYPQLNNVDDVFKLITDCIRRYGVKWVMFDNLQLFCDNTLRNQAHRTVHLSQLSKQFAKIAKDHRIFLIRILQPKRIDKHEIISTNDVDGSSQVAKDCDCMLTLWRATVGELKKSMYEAEAEGFTESVQSFDDKTRVTVGLSRYSSGGHTYLRCEGAKSRFTSYPESQKRAFSVEKVDFNKILVEAPMAVPVVPTEGIQI